MLKGKSKIHYTVSGPGNQEALLLIHDNGYSSKIFDSDIKFYEVYFKTITVDLAGHGKSGPYPPDGNNFWKDNASRILEVLKKLKIKKLSIIGTGGGSAVAMHMAIMSPETVKKIIADSPIGLSLNHEYLNSLTSLREEPGETDKQIFVHSNGSKWEKVLDNDTSIQKEFIDGSGHLFNEDIERIGCPVLITGSRESNLVMNNEEVIGEMAGKIKKSHIHLFNNGYHPTVISKSDEFRTISLNFIMD